MDPRQKIISLTHQKPKATNWRHCKTAKAGISLSFIFIFPLKKHS
jgi:hypothetical protein